MSNEERAFVRVTKYEEEWVEMQSFHPSELGWRNGQLAHLNREDRWVPFKDAVKRLVVAHVQS